MTASPTWHCPTCSLRRLPYGANCATWLTGCPNAATPNATGAWYLANRSQESAKGVGISEIADEDGNSQATITKGNEHEA